MESVNRPENQAGLEVVAVVQEPGAYQRDSVVQKIGYCEIVAVGVERLDEDLSCIPHSDIVDHEIAVVSEEVFEVEEV